MSQENVAIVRGSYEEFRATGELVGEIAGPDFIWDMSHFRGWPEEQIYEGIDGAERFLAEWTSAWDDWELDLDALHDAGDRVVAIVRQRGRSRSTGLLVDMSFAQVWTLSDGKETRMEMYSDPLEALKAVGLAE
jgi:ketosteroid isomerase-like protein